MNERRLVLAKRTIGLLIVQCIRSELGATLDGAARSLYVGRGIPEGFVSLDAAA